MATTIANKIFNWRGYEWNTLFESNRPLNPRSPWYYFDSSQVILTDRGVELSMAQRPQTIHWFAPDKWDISSIVEYHPSVATGLMRSTKTFLFGTFEAVVQLPEGANLWPSFWLTSKDHWPPEIDVFEAYSDENSVYRCSLEFNKKFPFLSITDNIESNVHYRDDNQEHLSVTAMGYKSRFLKKPVIKRDNVFKLIWTPDVVEFYVNGKLSRKITDKNILKRLVTPNGMWVVFNIWPGRDFLYGESNHITEYKTPYIIKDFKYTPYGSINKE